uniref:Uncharacterized protein n=1 Tax=viral metagenome TaxID=1070528 RepID=A0A6C0CM96_9ZZZZ
MKELGGYDISTKNKITCPINSPSYSVENSLTRITSFTVLRKRHIYHNFGDICEDKFKRLVHFGKYMGYSKIILGYYDNYLYN